VVRAAGGLAQAEVPQAIAALVALMRDARAALRKEAVTAATGVGAPEVVSALAEAMRDAGKGDRCRALMAAGGCPTACAAGLG
jgi:HEAT repeat protein